MRVFIQLDRCIGASETSSKGMKIRREESFLIRICRKSFADKLQLPYFLVSDVKAIDASMITEMMSKCAAIDCVQSLL